MKGEGIMSNQRVFDMELVKVESLENAVRTPFYQTDSTGGSVWVHGAKNTGTEDIVFVSIVAPVPADYDPVNTN